MSGSNPIEMMLRKQMFEQAGMDSNTATLLAMQNNGNNSSANSGLMTMVALGGMAGAGNNTALNTMLTAQLLQQSGVDPTLALMQAQMLQNNQHSRAHEDSRREHRRDQAEQGRRLFYTAYEPQQQMPTANNMMPAFPMPQQPGPNGQSFTPQYNSNQVNGYYLPAPNMQNHSVQQYQSAPQQQATYQNSTPPAPSYGFIR